MGRYRMKMVSRLTGMRPELLRMWERRYHLFKPRRADNRYREFDDEDLQLLLYIRQQIDQGRSIGELAAEGRAALLRQMTPRTAPTAQKPQPYTALIDELLGYIQHLEKGRLEARLMEWSLHLSFDALLHLVFVPLMHRLGDLWAAGETSIASEHFATTLLKQRLLTMLQATAPGEAPPLVLCACPPGEHHELGLLTFAYAIQQEGWQVCYLGPNLPLADLLACCQRLQPALVALSLTVVPETSTSSDMVAAIDTVIAQIYPTIIGGQAIAGKSLPSCSLRLFDSLSAARAYLRRQLATTTTSGPCEVGPSPYCTHAAQ